jgi:hypothetical protein
LDRSIKNEKQTGNTQSSGSRLPSVIFKVPAQAAKSALMVSSSEKGIRKYQKKKVVPEDGPIKKQSAQGLCRPVSLLARQDPVTPGG